MNNDINTSLRPTLPTSDRTLRENQRMDQRASDSDTSETVGVGRTASATASQREAEQVAASDQSRQPEREQVEQAASELARRAEKMGRDLRFEVDDDSGMTVVKVIDRSTDEVVRQIPSEEAVARAANDDDSMNLINASA